jgi:uncharacterized protein
MERQIYHNLLKWKSDKNKKPLIFTGARQVGKTYILKEFGKREYRNTFHFDFEREGEDLIPIFEKTINPKKIIQNLSILREQSINLKTDLIIFDEIQLSPRALTSLKYFSEDFDDVSICAAGSLLGLSLGTESYPVGKVSYLTLYPMTFLEFLTNDNSSILVNQFKMGLEGKKIELTAHNKLLEKLYIYYVIGGLPEVVATYFDNKNDLQAAFGKVRTIQNNLVRDYMNDFTKHAGKLNSLHIQTVFQNIPLQLAMSDDYSVNRYKFKDIIPGKKGFGPVKGPISWLEKSGLIIKTLIANRAEIPLLNFCKDNIFKLYMFDIGILGAMLGIEPKTLMLNDYGITKGFFVENYCLQEILASSEEKIISWNERNAEIEYVVPVNQEVIPVEIKSGKRTKSQSLSSYRNRYNPKYEIQLTTKECNISDSGHINIPLYYAGNFRKFIPTE